MPATVGKLEWDQTGKRYYQNGVSKGVLYTYDTDNKVYNTGVAWNGLTSIQVTPSGGEASDQYADDMKYLSLYSVEENGGTIEAFTYPDEFEECDGSKIVTDTVGLMARAQERKPFGLCWRTKVGNDLEDEVGYIIHILYGCKVSPSERQYQTINDSPEPITFSWELTTTPPKINLDKFKSTSLFEIDSRKCTGTAAAACLATLEDTLYGTNTTGDNPAPATDPTLPLPTADEGGLFAIMTPSQG